VEEFSNVGADLKDSPKCSFYGWIRRSPEKPTTTGNRITRRALNLTDAESDGLRGPRE
jgi:hypothetical protein